jgi:tetratricopeptide (TPR) repeat protein
LTFKKQNKLKDAISVYEKCIEINPEFANVYSGLGTVFYASGDYLNAITNFKKFTELTTSKKSINKINEYIARAYTKLGMSAKTDAKYDLAVEYFNNAVKSHPYDAAYLALAEVHVETGAYDKALSAADNAINNRKKIAKGAAYYYKGLAFKGMKDKTKAIENFEIAKKDRQYKANSEYELKLLNE